jgi:CspA family cold shock protein
MTMKLFGTVKSFNEEKGQGSITPEKGGEDLRFERSAISWGKVAPKTGQRLSYELAEKDGQSSAVNLETI